MNQHLTSLKSRLTIVTVAAILAVLAFAVTSSAATVTGHKSHRQTAAGSTKRAPRRQVSPEAVAITSAKVKAAKKAKASAEAKAEARAEAKAHNKAEHGARANRRKTEFRIKVVKTKTRTKTKTEPVSSSPSATTTVVTTTATATAAATPTTTTAGHTATTTVTATATASVPVTTPGTKTHKRPVAKPTTPKTPVATSTSTSTTPVPTTTTPTTTSTTPTTATTTTTPPTTTTSSTSSTPVPQGAIGVIGNWNLSFDDEFNGTSLDTTAWFDHDGWTNQNGVTDEASNVSVSGGYANLTLSSATSGATISTNSATLGIGDYAEARIDMPGNGSAMDDWDAFWTSGPAWPAAGENDVTESLGGDSTVNYHSPSGTHNQGTVAGDWGGSFHTYGIYRGSDYVDVYRDGVLVKSYSTDDNSQPETFIFTVGNGDGDPVATGTAGTMKIDYLRVWTPA